MQHSISLSMKSKTLQWLVIVFGSLLGSISLSADEYVDLRSNMVAEIKADVRQSSTYSGKTELDAAVLAALAKVPRHEFVPGWQRRYAYYNRPLSIGYGQTISQPFIVAIMTDLLAVDADDAVFELGTGSGYQAAVLAELVREVYSMEIIEELGEQAQARLAQLGYDHVTVRVGDGYHGWPEHGPYDAIIVTAASDHIPPPLVQQLKPGGRMMIPVGSPFFTQQLVLVEKQSDGAILTRELLPVRFVPLTRSN